MMNVCEHNEPDLCVECHNALVRKLATLTAKLQAYEKPVTDEELKWALSRYEGGEHCLYGHLEFRRGCDDCAGIFIARALRQRSVQVEELRAAIDNSPGIRSCEDLSVLLSKSKAENAELRKEIEDKRETIAALKTKAEDAEAALAAMTKNAEDAVGMGKLAHERLAAMTVKVEQYRAISEATERQNLALALECRELSEDLKKALGPGAILKRPSSHYAARAEAVQNIANWAGATPLDAIADVLRGSGNDHYAQELDELDKRVAALDSAGEGK